MDWRKDDGGKHDAVVVTALVPFEDFSGNP